MPNLPSTAVLCLLAALGGCSDASTGTAAAGGRATSADADAGTENATPARLEFATRAVEVDAGESVELELLADDLEGRPIRFWISGSAPGAYLSDAELHADEDGRIRVTLAVPGQASTFSVVASVGSSRAEVEIVVHSGGVTRLVVSPRYAGSRDVDTWQVDVHVDAVCESVEGRTPERSARASDDDLPLRIDDVPAGKPLAIVARAGVLAQGCRQMGGLLAAETTTVQVLATDNPLRLGNPLRITFDLAPSAEFSALLQTRIDAIVAAVRGPTGDDIAELLDAMHLQLRASDRDAFTQARDERNWYSRVGVALTDAGQIRTLSGILASRLLQTTQRLYDPETLHGVLLATPELPGRTFVQWRRVAGLAPELAGFPEEVITTASSEAGDTVRIGSTVPWQPNTLLVNLLRASTPADSTIAETLADELGCDDVGEALTTALTVDEVVTAVDAFDDCDRTCVVSLCRGAVKTLWDRGLAVTPIASTLAIAAAGVAQLEDDTNVAAFSGEWLGTARSLPEEDAPVRGTFVASQTESP